MNPDVHRGISVKLKPLDYAHVHDQSVPVEDRAHHLMDAVTLEGTQPVGQHWSTDLGVSEHFAKQYGSSHDDHTHVIFHATHPDDDEIENDEGWRAEHEVNDDEEEVPVRRGTDLEVKAVSWRKSHKPGEAEHPWNHHRFAEEQWHTASRRTAAGHQVWFHGTRPEAVPDIRERGLSAPPHKASPWYLQVTDNHEQAKVYAGPGGKVLEYHLPHEEAASRLGEIHPHNMFNQNAQAASIRTSLPSDYLVAEHDVPHRTASQEPVTIRYVRNPVSSQQHGDFGEQFAQHVEPHGRYLSERSGDFAPQGWETGEVTFHKPLRVPFGGTYQEPSNWKHQLSQRYDGKTGRDLSEALRADGHDGIITHDEYGTSEIVDLTGLHPRKAARLLTCETCGGSGTEHSPDKSRSWACRVCDGDGQRLVADHWDPPSLHERHTDALDTDDYGSRSRKLLDLAKTPDEGTHVWRGEVRHKDDVHAPSSVGMHWSVNPNQVIFPPHIPKDHHRVVWQAVVDHPEKQVIPRSHPIWHGQTMSMDNEAEVRFKPGAQVRLNRAYVHHGETGGGMPAPRHSERTDMMWQAHDMDHHTTVEHKRPADGMMEYQKKFPDLFRHQGARDDDLIGQLTFSHHRNVEGERDEIHAHHPDAGPSGDGRISNWAGHISWFPDGEIAGVAVSKAYQRRGLATELWNRAKQVEPNLRHSDIQSGSGRAWAAITAAKKVRKTERPQKCKYCKSPAIKSLLWAEGMAYVPVCGKHEANGRHRIEVTNEDEVVGVHQIQKASSGYLIDPTTNWDEHTDEAGRFHSPIHRGIKAYVPDELHDMLRDESVPQHEKAHALLDHIKSQVPGAGMHWTDREDHARRVAQDGGWTGNEVRPPEGYEDAASHPVVLHAAPPHRDHIETDKQILQGRTVTPYVSQHAFGHDEGEVPIKQGAPLEINGISWHVHHWSPKVRRQHDGWFRHDFAEPQRHVGSTTAAWTPHDRIFTGTNGLDKRLFDGDHLKPDVRAWVLKTLSAFWTPRYGHSWAAWARVYFAGSEASEWTSPELVGNGDFDTLIGVDYDRCRATVPTFAHMSDDEITAALNADLRALDEQTSSVMIPVDGKPVGPFGATFYVNAHSWDIRDIKPYAAYDVTNDVWAVKPPHLPDWDISKFPEGPALLRECRAVAAYVRAILALPEPERTQQGFALWQHLHSDRSRAFGPQGEGWWDSGNVIEKFLDQAGLWEKLVEIMVRAREHPETLNTPNTWSNDPRS